MGNVSKRVKYGRYYYLEYFLVVFLTKLYNVDLQHVAIFKKNYAKLIVFLISISIIENKI